jgi:hypothetical protein
MGKSLVLARRAMLRGAFHLVAAAIIVWRRRSRDRSASIIHLQPAAVIGEGWHL